LLSVGRRGSNSGAAGVSKRAKLPAKNPMVLQKQNGSYYRVRVLKEETYRVKIGNALGSVHMQQSVCMQQTMHMTHSKQCTLRKPSNVHCATKECLLSASAIPLVCTKQCALHAFCSCAVRLLAYTAPALC